MTKKPPSRSFPTTRTKFDTRIILRRNVFVPPYNPTFLALYGIMTKITIIDYVWHIGLNRKIFTCNLCSRTASRFVLVSFFIGPPSCILDLLSYWLSFVFLFLIQPFAKNHSKIYYKAIWSSRNLIVAI